MANDYYNGGARRGDSRQAVENLLSDSPSFRHLDGETQQALTDALSRITDYLAPGAASGGLATQMAPTDLERRLAPPGPGAPVPAGPGAGAPGGPAAPGGAPVGQTGAPASATARVGDVARATLNAISFPDFVASLIKGTFQAITEASIQQMEAYADLLKNVATTVDRFMSDNITDGAARDYLADQYDGFLVRDAAGGGQPRLRVNPQKQGDEMPGFFKDLGFESPDEIDDRAIEENIVPAARKSLAERRQQTLATMVLMGINRVVVDDGEILAKLVFHIDASETMNFRFDQQKTVAMNMARPGKMPVSGNGIMVNTASL
ncbi:MAG TPA: hypothetical protein VF521_00965, partial [Pyrinomonadaceae bacterium]